MDFGVDNPTPAVVAIDLHRGHLDPEVATMPLEAERAAKIVEANGVFFDACREAGIPIYHIVTRYRDVAEIRSNPFWRTRADDPNATRKNVERHNLDGLPGCEVMPRLWREGDRVVDTKKRYDCFVATDLDFTLRRHGINTLLITGVNTSSCVLATAIRANVLDYASVCIEDCVDTMDGPVLHEAALTCLRAAFGWVMSAEEALGHFAA
ncbi:cysteine hydrolase [Ponticoccus sp. SC2-23]|uniref:cysteine hydrolase family protein n=1 Tax=Alexandriicola marinus TaxID=2081710 RepID=UPI000FD88B8E|nr:cysteine hydrolase [Alexandriicola marinus]MBM1218588.1 cysteine hydrolase [Ponticoccus sp. SC6-9]MBM1224340.1 cysteine hydrolase [Ponticoccus sp. SC6-15]MBM1229881.1 cysteine hydrolase [Ponticoccus sp. SC6-38]MBM1233306.1 cysteine hydrolase [Ponticoccus sp. SC6-45]MBM1236744.1 cysteine hydrolase [Ponticoccus sp. SC6-49]MBM1242317.1 cysteine hydrolase [Ponticoccus sp. SC2-64]MBM1246830.1 cysteine hydrolase [Ponticoccus sp. SC6-42]MBM1251308.1 cysteine hydrolase [Ponticoccus sp. SC6-33]M